MPALSWSMCVLFHTHGPRYLNPLLFICRRRQATWTWEQEWCVTFAGSSLEHGHWVSSVKLDGQLFCLQVAILEHREFPISSSIMEELWSILRSSLSIFSSVSGHEWDGRLFLKLCSSQVVELYVYIAFWYCACLWDKHWLLKYEQWVTSEQQLWGPHCFPFCYKQAMSHKGDPSAWATEWRVYGTAHWWAWVMNDSSHSRFQLTYNFSCHSSITHP